MGGVSQAKEFYDSVLGRPRFICAPMVRGSERAFRELVRRHGIDLAYCPMLDACELVEFAAERGSIGLAHRSGRENIEGFDIVRDEESCVVQLAGNCPDTMTAAAKLVEPYAAAVCVNLGCPQSRAKRENFGAFLCNQPDLVVKIVQSMVKALNIPVWCKMRIHKSGSESTTAFALRLQQAGCSLLAIHARTIDSKFDGPVDMQAVAEAASALRIPVIFNGGVSSRKEAERILEEHPGFSGVMVASEILANPRMFSSDRDEIDLQESIDLAFEYLEFAYNFKPPSPDYIQLHMRHMFRKTLSHQENLFWWRILSRPWMRTPEQYMAALRLLARDSGLQPPRTSAYLSDPLPESIKEIRKMGTNRVQDVEEGWSSSLFSSVNAG